MANNSKSTGGSVGSGGGERSSYSAHSPAEFMAIQAEREREYDLRDQSLRLVRELRQAGYRVEVSQIKLSRGLKVLPQARRIGKYIAFPIR